MMDQLVYLPERNETISLASIARVEWTNVPERVKREYTTTVHLISGQGFYIGPADAEVLSKRITAYNGQTQHLKEVMLQIPEILFQLGVVVSSIEHLVNAYVPIQQVDLGESQVPQSEIPTSIPKGRKANKVEAYNN